MRALLANALLITSIFANDISIEAIAKDSSLWSQIDAQNSQFPEEFHFGIATCEYQYSGSHNCPDSQWADFEKKCVDSKQWNESMLSGKVHDHWNNTDTFVEQLEDLGVTSYRFSVEWSKIEPQCGVFNKEAIAHYKRLIYLLKNSNIEPMITLHHFSEPQWFFDLGSFEVEENIALFTRFAKAIFTELESEVRLWATINEPEVVAFQGYVMGEFPPARFIDFQNASEFLANMLKAHCEVYRALKKINPKAQIGIVHDGIHFIPKHSWNPIESNLSYYLSHICHDAVLTFLKTGKYEYYIPALGYTTFEEPDINSLFDWIGVNYYTRPLISSALEWPPIFSTCEPSEAMTTYQFREDPAGLYEILKETFEATGKPIYVTETGCPTDDDWQRCRYFERARYTISKAIEEGIPVKGMYAWSLQTNFEWGRGLGTIDFGLISFDGKIRTSYYDYKRVIREHKQMHESETDNFLDYGKTLGAIRQDFH